MSRYWSKFFSFIFIFILGQQAGSAQQSNISAASLLLWLDSPDPPLVLDVRGRLVYRGGTIPGALDGGIDPEGFLPDSSGDPVVLIIPKNAASAFVSSWTERLRQADHQVWILQNGLSDWIAKGGPVEIPELSYTRPGTVPFLIPRGLCDGQEPAQVFE